MKKIGEFFKKYKFHIVTILLFVVWIGSCSKNKDIRKLTKANETCDVIVDSLENRIVTLDQKIDSFPEIMRQEKLNIHIEYDNHISAQDRGRQLMDLHMIVKKNLNDLQK